MVRSNILPGPGSGTSVSTDGGATFTRLLPAPFALGHGTNFGDPIVAPFVTKTATTFTVKPTDGLPGTIATIPGPPRMFGIELEEKF